MPGVFLDRDSLDRHDLDLSLLQATLPVVPEDVVEQQRVAEER